MKKRKVNVIIDNNVFQKSFLSPDRYQRIERSFRKAYRGVEPIFHVCPLGVL